MYAVLGGFRAERLAMGWGNDVGINQTVFRSRGAVSIEQFCDEIQREYPDALHLVAGLSSATGRALSRIVRTSPPDHVAVFSERPGAYGPLVKRLAAHLLVPVKYRWLVRRYRRCVGLLLPLGRAGIETFAQLGWPIDRQAPFMYCPPYRGGPEASRLEHDGPVRFVYVGRMSRYTKGTDILLRATEQLKGDWSLTLVGGHGDMVKEIESWARARPNIHVLGGVASDKVKDILEEHDVCVVPSRFDGWNAVVNEAIYAGMGVIATDEAVSHELIEASEAGNVVRARSPRLLAAAMQSVIDDRSLLRSWSQSAIGYRPTILPPTVGQYLFELLRAQLHQPTALRSGAPWLRGPSIHGESSAVE